MLCAEDVDIQRVTLKAGHSLFQQDYQRKRSFIELARDGEEERQKRFRRSLATEDLQGDYIDNRIYLAGESIIIFLALNYYSLFLSIY